MYFLFGLQIDSTAYGFCIITVIIFIQSCPAVQIVGVSPNNQIHRVCPQCPLFCAESKSKKKKNKIISIVSHAMFIQYMTK